MLYLHNIKVLWLRDPKHPKAIGFRGKWKSLFEPLTTTDHFQEGQVVPFELHTRDGETLFAWHVVPASNELSRDAVKLQDGQEEALRRLKSRGVRLFVFCRSCLVSPLTRHSSSNAPQSTETLLTSARALVQPSSRIYSSQAKGMPKS